MNEAGRQASRNAPKHGDRLGVPAFAWMLGAAGLIPFVGLAAALFIDFGIPRPWAALALPTYAAVILSFMGGVHWGIAMRAGEEGSATSSDVAISYVASVVPALSGWFALISFNPGVAMAVIAAAFCVLLVYDFWSIRRGLAPKWYAALRMPLTIVVVLSLILAGYALA